MCGGGWRCTRYEDLCLVAHFAVIPFLHSQFPCLKSMNSKACRRQPPPVVIYSLLSAYPESVLTESNFGELPLHAVVRCGACAEVVNCILASYPAAALARDNSGCTPLDILNGTGKMMDHDTVVAALNRTINVLTREERVWENRIAAMHAEAKKGKEKRRKEYERVIANKNTEILEFRRLLEQEKLATSNLATKVIHTEQLVLEKNKVEKQCLEKIRKGEELIGELVTSNNGHKAKIKELGDIVRSSRKTILNLNDRVQSLQSSMTSLLQDEETFVATKLLSAEKNFKTLMEHQFVFLRETERRKELLKVRMKQLGIKSPKKNAEEDENKKIDPTSIEDEVSNSEVAEKALASAIEQLGIISQKMPELDDNQNRAPRLSLSSVVDIKSIVKVEKNNMSAVSHSSPLGEAFNFLDRGCEDVHTEIR